MNSGSRIVGQSCRILMVLGWIVFGEHTGRAAAAGTARPKLSREEIKTGSTFLGAFAPVGKMLQRSVVKLDVSGSSAALGLVVDSSGLVLSKASEVNKGKLTAWLMNGTEVSAKVLAVDEPNDVALVKVEASGLKAISWGKGEVRLGQWMITPGTDPVPLGVGVLSVPARKIQHKRALIGVQLDLQSTDARIAEIMHGFGAERAGLKPGDLVRSVNGNAIRNRKELLDMLREYRAGQKVNMKIQRGEQELQFEVPMMEIGAELGGGRMDREERMNRMGSDLSERAEGFDLVLQHDTVLQAWQCGGPLVDLEGNVVGMNIARAGRVATYALPAGLVRQISERLKTAATKSGRKS